MSVIARQSLKYTLIGYLGFLLGTLSAIFVFPRDLEFYGKLRFIMNSAEVIVPFIVFGVSYPICLIIFTHLYSSIHS